MKLYQTRPCAECPWRRDISPGQFPAERFIILACTAYDMNLTQFACHKSPEGAEFGCAGFLLRGATHNLGTRLAIRAGKVPPNVINPLMTIEKWRSPME